MQYPIDIVIECKTLAIWVLTILSRKNTENQRFEEHYLAMRELILIW